MRYQSLFALPPTLSAIGAPVVVESAELLLDQLTGRHCGRVILKNISARPFSAVDVTVVWQDEDGDPLGEPVVQTYETEALPREGTVGGDLLLPVSKEAKRLALRCLQVRFADGGVWSGENAIWEPLPSRKELEPEAAELLRLRFGEACRYVPEETETLRLCLCGATNGKNETCHRCGVPPICLDEALLQELRQEQKLRQEEKDRQSREEESRRAEAQRDSRAQRRRDRQQNLLGVAAAILVAALGFVLLTPSTPKPSAKSTPATSEGSASTLEQDALPPPMEPDALPPPMEPASCYEAALTALAQQDYPLAYRYFSLAGDYGDAKDYLERFRARISTQRCTTVQTEGLMETPENLSEAAEASVQEVYYTYDGQGRLLSMTEVEMAKNADGQLVAGNILSQRTYRYDEAGRLVHIQVDDRQREYVYDRDGRLLLERCSNADGTLLYETVWTELRDEQGNVVRSESRKLQQLRENVSIETITEILYDTEGRATEERNRVIHTESDQTYWSSVMVTREYDERGNVIRLVSLQEGETETWTMEELCHYNGEGDLIEKTVIQQHTSDGGDMVMYGDWEGRKTEQWWYDGEGREVLFLETGYFGDGHLENYQLRRDTCYDEAGNVLQTTTQNRYPNISGRDNQSTETYSYDEAGRLIQLQSSEKNAQTRRVISYDDAGRMVRQETEYREDSKPRIGYVVAELWTYDGEGMLLEAEYSRQDLYDAQDSSRESRTYYDSSGQEVSWIWSSERVAICRETTYVWFYYPPGTPIPEVPEEEYQNFVS